MKTRHAERIRNGILLAHSRNITGLVYDTYLRGPQLTRRAYMTAATRAWQRQRDATNKRDRNHK